MKPLHFPSLSSRSPYICASCLSRSPIRFQSTITHAPPSSPTSGYSPLASRRLISLTGPDATHYLQGVITTSILSPAQGPRSEGFYTAFLNAQGRVLNDVFIYPYKTGDVAGEGWLIEVDAKEAEKLSKHIRRYKLRAKFDVRLLDIGEKTVWSVWNDGIKVWSDNKWTRHSLTGSTNGLDNSEHGSKQAEIGCEDNRAPGMGKRLILPAGQKPEEEVEETTEDAYRIRRYLKGVPEGQDELIRESALPQESNIDFMGGIDYKKGCYVGQELTIRTHHRGVIRKRILPVMLYGKDETIPETLKYIPDKNLGVQGGAASVPMETSIGRFEKRGRSAGKWLAGVGNIGLGLCRLEIMTDVSVPVEQAVGGGYDPSDEFKVEWTADDGEKLLKVKAFVPSWHLKQ
ncbi:hypothetical protein B7463_g11506, partial [Scytalidium lignicola]